MPRSLTGRIAWSIPFCLPISPLAPAPHGEGTRDCPRPPTGAGDESAGCRKCHGSTAAFLKQADGSTRRDTSGRPLPDPATRPNTGTGRVSLDGSAGACPTCHAQGFIVTFHATCDGAVEMWNSKFARPARRAMGALRKQVKPTATPFNEEVEWSFHRLWRHEGRRGRMGVSTQGPDDTQWHGFFEVAERLCYDFPPKAREATRGDPEVARVIQAILDSPGHARKKGMSPGERSRIDTFTRERYGTPTPE